MTHSIQEMAKRSADNMRRRVEEARDREARVAVSLMRPQANSDSRLEGALGSYALVNRTGSSSLTRGTEPPLIVPIIPRHMEDRHWRAIYAMDPVRVVIKGEVFDSLCDACMNAFPCAQSRRRDQQRFKCKAKTETLIPLRKGRQ
jgi:hypothetical protein